MDFDDLNLKISLILQEIQERWESFWHVLTKYL